MNILKKYSYILKDLDCAACAQKIQDELSKKPKYQKVNVNFSTLKLSFESEEEANMKEEIQKIIANIEPEVEVLDTHEKIEKDHSKKSLLRLGIGIFSAIVGIYTTFPFYISEGIILFAYGILLFRTIKNAIQILKNSRSIDENFLVAISCIGAYFVGEKGEGLMVIILYEIGKILEEKAIHNTRKSIQDLMDIKPEYANLKKSSGFEKVSPETLLIGDKILVKQGEKVPVDGILIKGSGKLNTSMLTGESALVKVKEGDSILSGSINVEGLLEIEVTCEYKNSTVNRILELVENATDKKAKTETFVSKAAKIYTPIVLGLAVLVALLLPVFTDLTYWVSIYRALIFLVISCPCAIAISVPLSYFTGIGKASKEGILIKGSDYLDGLKDTRMIIFDKTGTITTGTFQVEKLDIYNPKYKEDEIRDLYAKGENFSNHPIAQCILEYIGTKVDTKLVKNYREVPGQGIAYELKNETVKIGNASFCDYKRKEKEDGTRIYLNYKKEVIASIQMKDGIKPLAKETIYSLKSMGIQTAMFTGDNKKVAQSIASKIGIDEVKAELLPTEKYQNLETLLKETTTGKIVFVGDGINDAPVLARSDIGISMGNLGSSSAIEASDIVIMHDELEKIPTAIEISKKTRKIIIQNLVFALATKIIILGLSVIGIAGMWQAIFADVGVTLITILNTTRILKSTKKES